MIVQASTFVFAQDDLLEGHSQLYEQPMPDSYYLEFETYIVEAPPAWLLDEWYKTIETELPDADKVTSSEIINKALSLWDASKLTTVALRVKSDDVYNVDFSRHIVSWDKDLMEFALWEDHREFRRDEGEFWRIWHSNKSFQKWSPAPEVSKIDAIKPYFSRLYFFQDGGTIRRLLDGSKDLETARDSDEEIVLIGKYQSNPSMPASDVWFSFIPDFAAFPSLREVGMISPMQGTPGSFDFAIWYFESWITKDTDDGQFSRPESLLLRRGSLSLEGEGIEAVDLVRASPFEGESIVTIRAFDPDPDLGRGYFEAEPPEDKPYSVMENGEMRTVVGEIEQRAIAEGVTRTLARRDAIVDEARTQYGFAYMRWLSIAGACILIVLLLWRVLRK